MIVTFCGHSGVTEKEKVTEWLVEATQTLILKGAKTFYLGGYGEFDSLCKNVLLQHKVQYPDIELILVVPYLNHSKNTQGYDGTIYPEIETVPPRFAIAARNKWMVEQADVVVAYVIRGWGGAAKTVEHARRKKKEVVSYGDSG